MAPKAAKATQVAKGSKRPAPVPHKKEVSHKKDVCVPAPQPKKAKKCPLLESVCAVVERAGLPTACRDMLLTTIPASFECYTEERHEIQRRIVDMVGELVEEARAALQGELDTSRGVVTELEGGRSDLQEKINEAVSSRDKAVQELEARKVLLAEAAAGENEAAKNLESVRATVRAGDEAATANSGNLNMVNKASDTDFPALFTTDDHAPLLTEDAVRNTMQPLLKFLVIDQSLVVSLPSVCAKKPSERGAFDTMVIEQLVETVRKKAVALSADIEQDVPAAKERAAAVDAAAATLTTKADAQSAALQQVDSVRQQLLDSETGVTRAREAEVGHAPALETATAVRVQKEVALQNFETHTVESFKLLRDRSRIPAVVEIQPIATQAESAVPTSIEASSIVPEEGLQEEATALLSKVSPESDVVAAAVLCAGGA